MSHLPSQCKASFCNCCGKEILEEDSPGSPHSRPWQIHQGCQVQLWQPRSPAGGEWPVHHSPSLGPCMGISASSRKGSFLIYPKVSPRVKSCAFRADPGPKRCLFLNTINVWPVMVLVTQVTRQKSLDQGSINLVNISKLDKTNYWQRYEQGAHSLTTQQLLVLQQIAAATLENNLALFNTVDKCMFYDPAIPLLGIHPRDNPTHMLLQT